jgi:formylglycine-generating enzyme required for sulfatase activity
MSSPGTRYYDVWHGTELTAETLGNDVTLSLDIEEHGFAAVFAQADAADSDLQQFLTKMKRLNSRPLSTFPNQWKVLTQTLVPIEPARGSPGNVDDAMIEIPAARGYKFEVHGIEIEGSNDIGVDVQYLWEDAPRRYHSHTLDIPAFLIDKYPVTNKQFKTFLDATHYQPADSRNFLKDWKGRTYPPGWDNKPVRWVSLEDARAYAKWAGKRLPHEWEWQYAAQGLDGRAYPWGNYWQDQCAPKPQHGHELLPPADVGAFGCGASPFGVMDMTGNVWQWTDEYQDEHTRAAILRGGGSYRPEGSRWYFPSAYRLDEHGKYLLMAPSKDRAGTLGFRCVRDTAVQAAGEPGVRHSRP